MLAKEMDVSVVSFLAHAKTLTVSLLYRKPEKHKDTAIGF